MLNEFITQNIFWVVAFLLVFNMLVFSFMRERATGAKKVSPLHLPQLQRSGDHLIIDVSEPAEFSRGHIPDAINIPLNNINDNEKSLPKDKESTVILVCQTGSRCVSAAKQLRGKGLSNLHILAGGMVGWNKENLPVTKNN